MDELPAAAAWRHVGARDGFEVLFLRHDDDGYRFDGHSTAVEDGAAWSVAYTIAVDTGWRTRSAHVAGRSATGAREVLLEADRQSAWRIDGKPAPHLDGCLDVDLEASAFTNAFPVRRLALQMGEAADAPAAYVRALDLRVERFEQRYSRIENDGPRSRYDYTAPAFDFTAVLVYDEVGLVLDYPGIALRTL